MRTSIDALSIGILLCESRTVYCGVRLGEHQPAIGISTYQVTRELPAPVREELPSVEDLQEVVTKQRAEEWSDGE